MKKVFLTLFIALFFLACLFPLVGLCIAGPAPAAANESPVATPKLISYDGSFNTSYLSDLSDYVNRGFYTRLNCITVWDTICARLFHTSENEEVIVGEDGWLYYASEFLDSTGTCLLTDRQIWCASQALFLMQEYAQNQGTDFLFAAPCAKWDLYPEHMPDYVKVSEETNIGRLQSLLEKNGVRYIDMIELFRSQDEVLYWKTDTHWNGRGAALAADAILTELGLESDYFDGEFTETEEPHTGDLYEMLYPAGNFTEAEYVPAEEYTFEYVLPFRTVNDVLIKTSCEEGSGTLLMFRDSYGRNLYPYFAQKYAEATFSRSNNFTFYELKDAGVSAVVVEIGEHNVEYLTRYPAVYESPERDVSVLDGMQKTESEICMESSKEMEGYVKLTGSTGKTAVDSPVYILASGHVYEAMPDEEAFTAYIPESDTETLEVYICP